MEMAKKSGVPGHSRDDGVGAGGDKNVAVRSTKSDRQDLSYIQGLPKSGSGTKAALFIRSATRPVVPRRLPVAMAAASPTKMNLQAPAIWETRLQRQPQNCLARLTRDQSRGKDHV